MSGITETGVPGIVWGYDLHVLSARSLPSVEPLTSVKEAIFSVIMVLFRSAEVIILGLISIIAISTTTASQKSCSINDHPLSPFPQT